MQTFIHHVSLLTGDMPATIAFYRHQLGLRLVKNTVNQENVQMRHVFLSDDKGAPGSVISFFGIDHLGPRYDQGGHLDELVVHVSAQRFATLAGATGHDLPPQLQLQDPNDVRLTILPSSENDATSLAAATLVVPAVAATAQFFARLLERPVTGSTVALNDDTHLTIRPISQAGTHRFGRGSIDHIALTVPDTATLSHLEQLAAKAGDPIEERIDRGWFESLYLREPGGNRIEFATQGPGFTVDEPSGVLGQGLGLPPRFATQREQITTYFHNKGVDFDD